MGAVLKPEEFGQSYFDGETARMRHNAGYSRYERWYRQDGSDSLGEYWTDYAAMLVRCFDLLGQKVLELGCAKGFVVEDLRKLGVDAFGCDVSQYAISKSPEPVRPFLQCGDALDVLREQTTNSYDCILSRGFLECLDPINVERLVVEMNRASRRQLHFVHTDVNPEFYTRQSLDEWAAHNWKTGTLLIAVEGNETREL